MRYVVGMDEGGHPIKVCDPMAETIQNIAIASGILQGNKLLSSNAGSYVQHLLAVKEIFGEDLATQPDFVSGLIEVFRQLLNTGATTSVRCFA